MTDPRLRAYVDMMIGPPAPPGPTGYRPSTRPKDMHLARAGRHLELEVTLEDLGDARTMRRAVEMGTLGPAR